MPRDLKPQDSDPAARKVSTKSISDTLGDVSEVVLNKSRTLLSDIAEELPSLRTQPTWIEWFGARLAKMVLLFIGFLLLLFVLIWWSTLPSISEVGTALGPNPDPVKLAEAFNKIRESHTQWVTEFFQPVVVTTLLPIFTLLAGYAFGSQQTNRGNGDNNGNG